MSASTKARIWPLAMAAPSFRARAGPRCGVRINVTGKLAAIAEVASVEPSSTTMISAAFNVCSWRGASNGLYDVPRCRPAR